MTTTNHTSPSGEELKPCPFCGGAAELQEYEEVDATRWAALVRCTVCGVDGKRGYANNRMGCFDAVNGLHKQSAIAGWNRRAQHIGEDAANGAIGEREALLADYIELNMSNYGPDDVDRLNAWAIEAYDFIASTTAPHESLTDAQIIAKCNAAGIKWIPPQVDEDDAAVAFPGMFDMASMDEMRAALTAEKVAAEPIYQCRENIHANKDVWADCSKDAHDHMAKYPACFATRIVYAAPQPAQTQVALTLLRQAKYHLEQHASEYGHPAQTELIDAIGNHLTAAQPASGAGHD
jgi:Lar family restriction alleviation protein